MSVVILRPSDTDAQIATPFLEDEHWLSSLTRPSKIATSNRVPAPWLYPGDEYPTEGATSIASDEADSGWKVLPFPQSLSNTIPDPAGWHTDERRTVALTHDQASDVVVRVIKNAAPNRPIYRVGFEGDQIPAFLVEDDQFDRGVVRALRNVAPNRSIYRAGFDSDVAQIIRFVDEYQDNGVVHQTRMRVARNRIALNGWGFDFDIWSEAPPPPEPSEFTAERFSIAIRFGF